MSSDVCCNQKILHVFGNVIRFRNRISIIHSIKFKIVFLLITARMNLADFLHARLRDDYYLSNLVCIIGSRSCDKECARCLFNKLTDRVTDTNIFIYLIKVSPTRELT